MTSRRPLHDIIFFYSLALPAFLIVVILSLLLLSQLGMSIPILRVQGLSTYTTTTWRPMYDPPPDRAWYGLLPAIWGTMVSAVIAILLGLTFTIALVVFMEEIAPRRVREVFSTIIDLMAGLPTVLYGVWGLAFLGPLLHKYVMSPLHSHLSIVPLFSCEPLSGATVFTAGVLLSIMITPFMVALVQESYRSIPYTLKEAAWSLGMTRYEYVLLNMRMIAPSIASAILLGFGRASSETAAVTLVVGNAVNIGFCIFAPAYTISSLIANQFTESQDFPYMLNALFAGGLILLIIGLIVNTIGVLMLRRVRF
jgi:phosphate ABC transporter, permease protein PstC